MPNPNSSHQEGLGNSTALGTTLARFQHLIETADVGDAFSELNENFLKLFDQIINPLYYFTTVLHNPTGRSAFAYLTEATGATPTEIGNGIYWEISELVHGYCTGLYTQGSKAIACFDPTLKNPLVVSVSKDAIATIAPFFKTIGIDLPANGQWQPQAVEMTLDQYKNLKFDSNRFPIEFEGGDDDSEGGGYNEPIIDPEVQKLIDDVGIEFKYRWVFRPTTGGDDLAFCEGALHLESVITLPTDFFQWLNGTLGTAAPNRAKFPFTLARDYLGFACRAYGTYLTWPVQITTPTIVKDRLDTFTQGVNGFQPRVNSRGWCITPNGGFFKPTGFRGNVAQRHGELLVERQDRLDALYAQMSNLQAPNVQRQGMQDNPEAAEQLLTLQKEVDAVQNSYNGRITVVDWINDKLHRYTSSGNEELVDMTGTRSLDPMTEAVTLNRPIGDMFFSASGRNVVATVAARIHAVIHDAYEAGVQNGTIDDNPAHTPPDVNYAFAQLAAASNEKFPVAVKHLMGIDVDNDFEDSPNGQAVIGWCNDIARAARAAVRDPHFFPSDMYNEFTQSTMMGYFADTLGNMTEDDYRKITASARASAQKNVPAAQWDPHDIAVPNIELRPGEFDSLMPHTADVMRTLLNFPDVALIDISAGGAKTITGIIEMLKLIEVKKARRPLAITAGNLVPSFITEINSVTNGKMNVVPLRVDTIRQAIERQNMKSIGDFVRWLRWFPPNTIFIAAYTDFTSRQIFFDDFDAPIAYGSKVEESYQYRQIMAAVGFDYVMIDESQFAKNREAARTKGAAYMLSRANYRRPASGSMTNNTVLDTHGQVGISINGAVLGTLEQFTTRYAIYNGLINDASRAIKLRQDIRQHSAMITKRKQDWAFMMPDITSQFFYCKMTQRQTEYYNRLMTELIIEIRREIDKLKAKNKNMSEEELEAKIISLLQYRLAKVEQFLVAPDLNKDYAQPADGSELDRDDLVSPEVNATDARIDAHIAAGRTDKIIVYGYHKAASAHFMKWSRHAHQAIRYTAGNLAAIETFKDPKGPFILVADENSMKQGFNLQIAGRVIRLQAVWAPGDEEQAVSRMYRPDPRGIFNRTKVNMDWILPLKVDGEATLSVAKTARMISKAISNAQFSNADDMAWRKISNSFDELPLLSMNLELVFGFKLEDAQPYLQGWGKLKEYENQQMTITRRAMAQRIEAKNPGLSLLNPDGTTKNMAEFARYVMVPIKEAPPIEGSKMVHVPWIGTAQPPDPYHLNLILGSDYHYDVAVNEYCMTEFGPGQIKAIKESRARVQTAVGIVNIPWDEIALLDYEDEQDETEWNARRLKLKTMFLNINRYALVPPGMEVDRTLMGPSPGRAGNNRIVNDPPPNLPGAAGPAAPSSTPEPAPAVDAEDLDLQAGVLNGMPVLFSKDEKIRDWLMSLHSGWIAVPQFISVSFTNWKGATNFLDALDQNFWIDVPVASRLRAGLADMQQGREVRANTIPNASLVRNFFVATHRRLPAKSGWPKVMPYWVTEGHNVRLAFSRLALDPQATRWLSRQGRQVAGVKKIAVNDGLTVNFFKSPRDAAQHAQAVVAAARAQGINVDHNAINDTLRECAQILHTMRRNTSQYNDPDNPSATGAQRGK